MESVDNNKTLVQVEDLNISLTGTDKKLVNGVSFSLEKGEILGLVGESGSGKTLTAKSLMQLLPAVTTVSAKQLNVALGDEVMAIQELEPEALRQIRGRRIAMIFQEPMSAFNPVMTCGKQVAEILELHLKYTGKEAKAEVLRLFESVKLPDPDRAWNSYPHQLSGGQLQRVMIAMAMACKPDLIIADEPTTALDVTVQKTILELLKDLVAEQGISMLFISHDLGVIRMLCRRVLVMQQGNIVEKGDVEQVFNKPQHTYTQHLIACRPQNLAFAKSTGNVTGNILLKAQGLTKIYPGKKKLFGDKKPDTVALNNVDITIYENEILGVVGESGSGKTTLSNILLGLTTPTHGQVIYQDKNLTTLKSKELKAFRKRIQVVFQNPYASLNPRMKIGHQIADPMLVHDLARNQKEAKADVLNLLEKVGLDADSYDRYASEFSGGQRQRIAIARALATQPDLIICDEPTSALDVSIQAQIIELLLKLKAESGLSYLFVSHDLHLVQKIADRIIVMENGHIVESGESHRVFSYPQHPYTQKLFASALD